MKKAGIAGFFVLGDRAEGKASVDASLFFGKALCEHLRKIDRIDHQRREATIARRVGNDLASKREQQARAFDEQHRQHMFLWEAGEAETRRRKTVRPQTRFVFVTASAVSDSTTSKSLSDSGFALTLTLILIEGPCRAWSERGAPGFSKDRSLIYWARIFRDGLSAPLSFSLAIGVPQGIMVRAI